MPLSARFPHDFTQDGQAVHGRSLKGSCQRNLKVEPQHNLKVEPQRNGYTLVEVVAVLAIIAILAAMLVPRIFQQLKRAARETEEANLQTLAEGLEDYIIRNQYIPGVSTWVQVLTEELGMSPNRVSATESGNARVYLPDPNLRIGTNSTSTLPYSQTRFGSVQPVSPRLIIVSSIVKPLPSLDGADFNTLWNTPKDTVPAGWGSGWNGQGEDIKIQRIDFRDEFHRLILSNLDSFNPGKYSIGTNAVVELPPGTDYQAWYLHGTDIGLHYTNSVLQAREFLRRDTSYVYENNHWGRDINAGKDNAGDFGQLVEDFLATPAPPEVKFGTTQQYVVDEFYYYMWTYALWAMEGFPYGSANDPGSQAPAYRIVTDSQDRMDDFSANLISAK